MTKETLQRLFPYVRLRRQPNTLSPHYFSFSHSYIHRNTHNFLLIISHLARHVFNSTPWCDRSAAHRKSSSNLFALCRGGTLVGDLALIDSVSDVSESGSWETKCLCWWVKPASKQSCLFQLSPGCLDEKVQEVGPLSASGLISQPRRACLLRLMKKTEGRPRSWKQTKGCERVALLRISVFGCLFQRLEPTFLWVPFKWDKDLQV